jgi:transcription-repair coupling factor (superfamily II helicase)
VLVSTTIIESGLDIPNANTLIIDNAVMYGLAQLYQLRGRVGRGANRAYAYFLYKPGSLMTEDAQKRLDTMLDTQELGAGFKIAMKDLEIRGAGNLLGAEQSGHIGAVGYELYIRMLEEAVEQQKGAEERPIEAQVDAPTVNLALPLPAFLPEDYIEDPAIRLDMYRKLAAPLQTAGQIRELVRELEDRFGKLPEPARNLMYLLDIKVLAIRAGIESMIEQDGEIYIRWPAPSVETEMRRQASKKPQPEPARKRSTGRANVDVRRLMKEFGENLRISPNQMRLNIKLLKEEWTTRLKELLEELVA